MGRYNGLMSIWSRIADALAALTQGEGLSAVFDRLRSPPERTVAFTIAVIALGAKMAKADGHVTRDEVMAFREVFHIAAEDEANAARVFNLARTDVAGFEDYARRIGDMFDNNQEPLEDLLAGLFHIAVADGEYHPNEEAFLLRVAELFHIDQRCFNRIKSQHVPDAEPDPYDVLGMPYEATLDELQAKYRKLVRETHPDMMQARGVPAEAVKLAERRMIAINKAWEQISREAAATA